MDAYAKKFQIPEVRGVVVDIGQESSVVPVFFRSCWDPAVGKSDHLQNADLELHEIPHSRDIQIREILVDQT
jgi:Zn finger protein HypA/HybF involved in hydrogenase expression